MNKTADCYNSSEQKNFIARGDETEDRKLFHILSWCIVLLKVKNLLTLDLQLLKSITKKTKFFTYQVCYYL